MMAEISIIPLDKGPSVSKYVAKILELINSSGLEYRINPMGTVIEGPGDAVFDLIKKCHNKMLEDSKRVVTSIKIDDKAGKTDMINQKLESVQDKLDFDLNK